ncbi:MAG: bifunctional phosphoribosylaminoimidazolecarboxamide formyltransferase/IMP cyclohydrolase [Candidatus Omnitrophota bacterium]
MLKIKRALISVSDKAGIVGFVRCLASLGVEIISTGGTARILKEAGIDSIEISNYTGSQEMLDGRVKTLHPKIHAGLLARRDCPEHMRVLGEQHIGLIDMVVVNLYPFEKTVQKKGVDLKCAIENIDIGGPSMLRSAAKNYESVAVVSDPYDYESVMDELKSHDGCLCLKTLEKLAVNVFKLTSSYDGAIGNFLAKRFNANPQKNETLPDELELCFKKSASLRYGENPHQKAALYQDVREVSPSLVGARQLHGKELSFNNYLDLNAAFEIVREFKQPAACIIKHSNPTGVAQASTLSSAYLNAWQTDSLSAFGGIVGLNRKVDEASAKAVMNSGFLECILAPEFSDGALDILKSKKNLRLIEMRFEAASCGIVLDLKRIQGGVLAQEMDSQDFDRKNLRCVTRKKPTPSQLKSLLFAWQVVKHVKSNAICLAKGDKTVGIGMGQTSRVDSVFMAIKRAGTRSKGAVLASDAFFPKADNITLAKKAGIKAIIQPGGSIADEEVIKAADAAGIVMVFTGFRHFKH